MSKNQKAIGKYETIVILSIFTAVVFHSYLTNDSNYILKVAVGSSLLMNLVYPTEAILQKKSISLEFLVSLILITFTYYSWIYNINFIIVTIFLHGIWDFFKLLGAGINFYTLYILLCIGFDWTYAIWLYKYHI